MTISRSLLILALVTSSCGAHAAQTAQPTSQYKYNYGLGAVACAAIASGLYTNTPTLTGIGLGAVAGTATYALRTKANKWVLGAANLLGITATSGVIACYVLNEWDLNVPPVAAGTVDAVSRVFQKRGYNEDVADELAERMYAESAMTLTALPTAAATYYLCKYLDREPQTELVK